MLFKVMAHLSKLEERALLIKYKVWIRYVECCFKIGTAVHKDIDNGLCRIPVFHGRRYRIIHPVIKRIGEIVIDLIEGFNAYFFKRSGIALLFVLPLYRNGDHFFLQI